MNLTPIRWMLACFLFIVVAVNVVATGIRYENTAPADFDVGVEFGKACLLTAELFLAVLLWHGPALFRRCG